MKPLRILSIDWDYLVNATLEQRVMMFPDCCNEDRPAYLQDIIWQGRYADTLELSEIGIDTDALKKIQDFIKETCDKRTLCSVYDSHFHLLDEVLTLLKDGQPLEIVNFDFHHDLYGIETDIDCGNWANALFEDFYRKSKELDKYYWIKREDSDENSIHHEYLETLLIENLQEIERNHFDLLFICRSSVWSPPHLDNEFVEFYTWITDNINRAVISITGSRYTQSFKEAMEQYRAVVNNIKEDING